MVIVQGGTADIDISSLVQKSGDTMTGALVLSGAPTIDLHAATKKYVDDNAGGGGGDFMADGSVPMTGTLELDPGADDIATIFTIPITNADGPTSINFQVAKTFFIDTDDITFNLGFYNGGSGPLGVTKHAWYTQWEYDYNDGTGHWAEHHLNLFSAGGGGIRPFEYKYKTDGTAGSILHRSSSLGYFDMTGTNQLLSCILGATRAASRFQVNGQFWPNMPNGDPLGFYMRNESGHVYAKFDTQLDWIEFKANYFILTNRAGANKFVFGDDIFTIYNESTTTALINVLEKSNKRGIFMRAPASNVKEHIVLTDNTGTIEFAIGIAGKIQTNQTAANTATPSGATSHQIPIYNEAGTLVCYVPGYAVPWT